MIGAQCAAMVGTAEKDSYWSFCPSIPASYVLAVVFFLTTITHLVQAWMHKKPYCWIIVCSGAIQIMVYISRIISIHNPRSFPPYAIWFVGILIAPVFTNAFVYMVLSRMVWNFVPGRQIFNVAAWRLGGIFVALDIIALIVQVIGAAKASVGSNDDGDAVLLGIHVYMGGIGIQTFFIFLFVGFLVKTHAIISSIGKERTVSRLPQAIHLVYVLYTVLIMILIRIVFRLIEYSQGLHSTIPNHEVYQYCLDTLPMLIASVLFNIFHPGRIMPGKSADIPGRKDRKQDNTSRTLDSDPADSEIRMV